MKIGFRKLNSLTIIALAATAVSGCFELAGDPVIESATPPPPPNSSNNPPTISGTPPTFVQIGENYSFEPSASDPDGDALTFAVQNLPAWASFDSTTGSISGIATLGSEGTYSNIQVSVSDGSLNSSLPAFSVNVILNATGTATLTWTAPTQNADGSPLTDLAAYRVYYGVAPGNYSNQITINNPGITTYIVEDLPPNDYYFVTTSVNSLGVESTFSNEAMKTITN